MKTAIDDNSLKTMIHQQVSLLETYENIKISLEHISQGVLKKVNFKKSGLQCVMDICEKGLFIVYMSGFSKEQVKGFEYLEFMDIQGIQIKEKRKYISIVMQTYIGDRYYFDMKKSENLNFVIDILKSHLGFMKNKQFQQRKRTEYITSFLYFITLIVLLIIPLSQIERNDHNYNFIPLMIGLGIIHYLLFYIIDLYVEKTKDNKCKKELQKIIKELEETNDYKLILSRIRHMKTFPKTIAQYNEMMLCFVKVYEGLGQYHNALDFLRKVRCGYDQNLQEMVYQRKQEILQKI